MTQQIIQAAQIHLIKQLLQKNPQNINETFINIIELMSQKS